MSVNEWVQANAWAFAVPRVNVWGPVNSWSVSDVVLDGVRVVSTVAAGGEDQLISVVAGLQYRVVGTVVGTGSIRLYDPAPLLIENRQLDSAAIDVLYTAQSSQLRVYLRNSVAGDVEYAISITAAGGGVINNPTPGMWQEY